MTSRIASWEYGTRRGLGALLVVGALATSCVAREPHQNSSGTGGSGATGGGSGGVELMNPDQAGAAGDPVTGAVPSQGGCRASDQCAMPFPYCLASAGRCVECISTTNCSGTGRRFCDVATNSCVACLNDQQCPHALPYCESSIGQCVECLSSDNCGSSSFACDRSTHACVPTCKTNADCASSPATPSCDPTSYVCVACVADDACPPTTPRCDGDTHTCVQCEKNGDCGSVTPFCDTRRHACVQCVTNNDCAGQATCISGACAPH